MELCARLVDDPVAISVGVRRENVLSVADGHAARRGRQLGPEDARRGRRVDDGAAEDDRPSRSDGLVLRRLAQRLDASVTLGRVRAWWECSC